MNNLDTYHKVLKQLSKWLPKERITRKRNMALLIVGLQQSDGIHLSKIVRTWHIKSKLPSLVTRLNRFLNNSYVDTWLWYQPLAKQILTSFRNQDVRLIIDCTKIGFGHRLMSVSVAYKKRSLPLIWNVYKGAKGHVKVEEQLKLLNALKPLIPKHSQVYFLGDAGFDSVKLFQWLSRYHWRFVIRQKGRSMVKFQTQDWVKLKHLELKKEQTRSIGWVRITKQHKAGHYWLILHWAKGEDEPWYLLTNFSAKASLIIRLYKIRMWTEEMYGDMKGHGFDIESTHLDDKDRIARLFLAVAFTFVWLIVLGSWLVKRGYRHLIDVKSRRDKSYFRLGDDWIKHCSRLNIPIPVRFQLFW